MDALSTAVPKLERLNALKHATYEGFHCGQEAEALSIVKSEAHEEDDRLFGLNDEEESKEVELLCDILASTPDFLGALTWNNKQALSEPHSEHKMSVDIMHNFSKDSTSIEKLQDYCDLRTTLPDEFLTIINVSVSQSCNKNSSRITEHSSRKEDSKVTTQAPLRSCLKRLPRQGAATVSSTKSVRFILNVEVDAPHDQVSQTVTLCKKNNPKQLQNGNLDGAHVKIAVKKCSSHKTGRSRKTSNVIPHHPSFNSSRVDTELWNTSTVPQPAGMIPRNQVAETDLGYYTSLPPPTSIFTEYLQQSHEENVKETLNRPSVQDVAYDHHCSQYYQITAGDKDDSQNTLNTRKSDSVRKNRHLSDALIKEIGEKGISPEMDTTSGIPKEGSPISKKDENLGDAVVARNKHVKRRLPTESQQKRPWKFWTKGDHLGSGSLATVYEGVSSTGRCFAVKEISLADGGKASRRYVVRLEQEICTLCELEHDNIVKYLGFENDEGKIFIFLELVTSGPLSHMYKKSSFGYSQVRSFTKQILHGLKYLHNKNIAHRDLKCDNILMHANGTIKLADYGIAQQLKKINPVTSQRGGCCWIAPEAKDANYCSLISDIWSLGCTVLEMITGSLRVPDMDQHNREEVPLLPETLSRDSRDFIRKCLQVDPSLRPTAAMLLEHSFIKGSES